MKKSTRILSFIFALLLLGQTLLLTGCQIPFEDTLAKWFPSLFGQEQPEEPDNPDNPEEPENPDEPENPENPEEPEEPEEPVLPPPTDYDFGFTEHEDSYYITSTTNLPEGVSLSDPEIYDDILDKWQEYLVGSLTGYETQYPAIKNKINTASQNGEAAWALFKETYQPDVENTLFLDTGHSSGDSWDEPSLGMASDVYAYIRDMALAYKMPGTTLCGNQELLSDIKKAMEYGYRFIYGENVAKLNSASQGNWWYWDIGFPLDIVEILIILKDELDQEDIEKYLAPFDTRNPLPSMTAANMIWIGYSVLASAALQHNGKRIINAKNTMMEVFGNVTSGDGFYSDGSFIQHRAQSASGAYGISLLSTLADVMIVLSDSRFAFRGEEVDNQFEWALEGLRPLVFNGLNLAASTTCREVSRENFSEYVRMRNLTAALTKMAVYAPEDVLPKIKSFLRTCMKASDNNFTTSVSLYMTTFLLGLDADDSVPLENNYSCFKVYGNMDRVVCHNANYGVCVAMSSTRIAKYEALNDENKRGWYQGDGMIYIYTDGFDYDYLFFSRTDAYRMPGTTVSTMTRKEENLSNSNLVYGASAFAGGLACGNFGVAAFQLSYKKHDIVKTPDVTGNKSYFMFDNEIVCLGSNLTTNSAGDFLTVVENRQIRDGDTFTVNGQVIEPKTLDKKISANFAHFDNMGGYVFLRSTELTYKKRATLGYNSLELVIKHSTTSRSTYAYAYLPEATEAATKAYAQSPNVTIKELSDNIHVVQDKSTGITAYVFFAAGTAKDGTNVSNPCMVALYRENGKYVVAVSDPTHKLSSFTVKMPVSSSAQVESTDQGVTASVSGSELNIKVTPIDKCGETYKVYLK